MLKHAGIYVADLKKMEEFYSQVFDMYFICRNQLFKHPLLVDLLKEEQQVRISKLVTEYGKKTGIGDMVELIEMGNKSIIVPDKKIYGSTHLAFGVQDMKKTVEKIVILGGKQKTEIYDMGNGNLCCFCTDPENNWLELIGKAEQALV